MNFLSRLSSSTWIIALLAACGFLLWIDAAQVGRVEYISGLAEPAVTVDAASKTGYATGLRRLIVAEHNNESYQWIAQTQQMLAQGEMRLRHVNYDNAPLGREVRTTSPYRWWLGLVAWCDHVASGRSLTLAVERAALFADPVLQFLLLGGVVFFTARKFGNLPATLLAMSAAAIFPFTSLFLPGQPTARGLALVCAIWSILPLLTGIRCARMEARKGDATAGTDRQTPRWFFGGGVAGGLGLWVSVPQEVPIIAGVIAGGIIVAWLGRKNATDKAGPILIPWRTWSFAGAATVLLAYFAEYFPAHLDTSRLETIHPVYGLAWLGAGELLTQLSTQAQDKKTPWTIRRIALLLFGVLALAALPVAVKLTGIGHFLVDDTVSSRLTPLSDSATAVNLWSWINRDGVTGMSVATLAPLLLIAISGWLLFRRGTSIGHRAAIALALGPVLVALTFSCFQLALWVSLDAMLLMLLVGIASAYDSETKRGFGGWPAIAGLAVVLAPGTLLLLGQTRSEKRDAVTENDVVALIERDLAYWLANQSSPEGAVVLAPPSLTTSLYFHGGLSGLGTPYWENKDGFAAAVRIAGASSADEAQTVAQTRNLTYIVIPSWDLFLDEYARLGSEKVEGSLMSLLHRWLAPRWLRAVPYRVPKIAGYEGLSVVVFQVVEVQDNVTALSRLAEYFVEMGQLDQAGLTSEALGRYFATEPSALIARTLVEQARGNSTSANSLLNEVATTLSEDTGLPWDRRVSLAIALAEGKRFELAREQTKRCLAELNEAHLRSLTPVSLYRFQVLNKAFGFGITDPKLRALAQGLSPAELRENL